MTAVGDAGRVRLNATLAQQLEAVGVAPEDARELAREDVLGGQPMEVVFALLVVGTWADAAADRGQALAPEAQAAFGRASVAVLPPVTRAALAYRRRGWSPVPIPKGSKAPVLKRWETLRPGLADVRRLFAGGEPAAGNVGIHLGVASGGLLDVDLDSPEALALAPAVLPPTPARFGRPGKPDSHWLYQCDPLGSGPPATRRFREGGKGGAGTACLVELRSSGGQTVFPPSTHPSGQAIAWVAGGADAAPSRIPGDELERRVGRLAAGALLVRHWPPAGSRHDAALALGAVLARAGWWEADVEAFVARVAHAAGDPEAADRAHAAGDSVRTVRVGRRTTGWKTLADLLGSQTCDRIRTWAELGDATDEHALYGAPAPTNGTLPVPSANGAVDPAAGADGATAEAEPDSPPLLVEAWTQDDHDMRGDAGSGDGTRVRLFPRSDLGNAERLAARFGGSVRYVDAWSGWLVWDGARWKPDTTGEVLRLAAATVRGIGAEARATEDDERAAALRAWALQSESYPHLCALLKLAAAQPGIAVEPTELDAHPHLLNTPGGTVDLRTGLRHAHDRTQLLTKVTAGAGDLDAPAPVFEAFLEQMWPDPAVRDYLQRVAGLSLVGDSVRVVAILHGQGRTGKTTLLEAMLAAVGLEYGQVAPPETLLDRKEGAIPNDLAMLRGARLVLVSEAEETGGLAESLVKRMTGGDMISARFMRGEFFSYRPQFTPWLATNYRPVVRGDDQGIWDRIKSVDCAVRLADEEVDLALPGKLAAEKDGVLAWMLRGAVTWGMLGLAEPEAVKEGVAEYRAEMDVLGRFLEECCQLSPQTTAPARDIYLAYKDWCHEVNEKPLSQRWLGQRLAGRGLQRRHERDGWHWDGVRVTRAVVP